MGWSKRTAKKFLVRRKSRLYHKDDDLYPNLTALTDLKVLHFMRGLRNCVLVTTTPSFNVLSARWVDSSVVKIGQEHKVFETHPAALQTAIRKAYPKLDAMSCITEAAASTYKEMLAKSKTAIQYIPNGTPFPDVLSQTNNKTVIAAGRLVDKTCFDRLIRLFAPVAKKHPDWQLKIFGDGDAYREQLRRIVFEFELQNHVFLMPKTNDIASEYANSDIYALSARVEPFGMVLIEAMAHEVPCVAFESQGPNQLIENEHTGFLIEPDNEVAFGEALCRLIEDDALRTTMGGRARESIQRYSMDRVGLIWTSFLESLGVTPSAHTQSVSTHSEC
tara:strand:- start:20667 stop:21665 length:999 start_codon:yes stop_codon:yes gene_type:complete